MGRISYTLSSVLTHFLLNFNNFDKQLNLWLTAKFQHEWILGALHFEVRSLSAVLSVKYYVPAVRMKRQDWQKRRNCASFSSTCSVTDMGGRLLRAAENCWQFCVISRIEVMFNQMTLNFWLPWKNGLPVVSIIKILSRTCWVQTHMDENRILAQTRSWCL